MPVDRYAREHARAFVDGLVADLHALFDHHLWSIDPRTGTLHVSPRLASSGYAKFAGRRIRHHVARQLLGYHYTTFLQAYPQNGSSASAEMAAI